MHIWINFASTENYADTKPLMLTSLQTTTQNLQQQNHFHLFPFVTDLISLIDYMELRKSK